MAEILSEATEEQDRTAKMQIYARHSVKEYWLIDPDRETLEVYKLDAKTRAFRHAATYQGDEIFRPALFPKLEITLEELWE
jgi:Uma2 family endonuclease